MFERGQQVLKLACLVFGAVVLVQMGLVIKRGDSLKGLTIPALPALASAGDTNSAAAKESEKKGTNSAAAKDGKAGTSALSSGDSAKKGTNSAAMKDGGKSGTNGLPETAKGTTNSQHKTESAKGATNAVSGSTEKRSTNGVAVKGDGALGEHALPESATNAAAKKDSGKGDTNVVATASAEKGRSGTNAGKMPAPPGTNSAALAGTNTAGTNAAAVPGSGTNATAKGGTNALSPQEMAKKGGRPGGRPEPGKAPADLPPLIKARVERITQSEIFGQIMRPMPMALLGIADKDVFLRAPDGQTGSIKEGGELGGVKLLRIGSNRILIEHEGEKKELTLFSGLGSETLLPKPTEKTNETTKKIP
jgi:hypothetical protein